MSSEVDYEEILRGMLQHAFDVLEQGAFWVGGAFGFETAGCFDGLGGAGVAAVKGGG